MIDHPPFRYLNLDNQWASFTFQNGLTIRDDGGLTLAPLPLAEATLIELTGEAAGPAGIGVDSEGNLYIADPAQNRILRRDGCSGAIEPLACFGGRGKLPGQLDHPRGVLVGRNDTLYVADSENHRIQVVDLQTLQLRAIWGQPDPHGEPQPGPNSGELNQPWDLAVDQNDYVYIVDYGNQRVQKFAPNGLVEREFWQVMQDQTAVPKTPAYITIARIDGEERLLIFDQAQPAILLYQTDGTYEGKATQEWGAHAAGPPAGIAFDGETLYIGDPTGRRVLTFGRDGRFLGAAQGYCGPVAGLTLDRQGRLVIHPGGEGAVTRLLPGQAFTEAGSFVGGPFEIGNLPRDWIQIRMQVESLSEATHLQLFTYLAPAGAAAPPPLPESSQLTLVDSALTPQQGWQAAPLDALDLLIQNEPGHYLWLGGVLYGDGSASPVLQQIRLDYIQQDWGRYLPQVYRQNGLAENKFLRGIMLLLESMLTDEERLIDTLPRRFDPEATPASGAPHAWLDWLASWLALELDETWLEERRRQAVRQVFTLYSQRGTVAGLKRLIALHTGTTVSITEPSQSATVWSLGETSALGFSTMLTPAKSQETGVETTATSNQPHLIGDKDDHTSLFDDLADHFWVQVSPGEASDPRTIEKIQHLLEREKPAHMSYHLCVIEPRMRVGFQMRIGIDSIVAGPPPGLRLDEASQLGLDTALPDSPKGANQSGLIGQNARVGQQTRLV